MLGVMKTFAFVLLPALAFAIFSSSCASTGGGTVSDPDFTNPTTLERQSQIESMHRDRFNSSF